MSKWKANVCFFQFVVYFELVFFLVGFFSQLLWSFSFVFVYSIRTTHCWLTKRKKFHRRIFSSAIESVPIAEHILAQSIPSEMLTLNCVCVCALLLIIFFINFFFANFFFVILTTQQMHTNGAICRNYLHYVYHLLIVVSMHNWLFYLNIHIKMN